MYDCIQIEDDGTIHWTQVMHLLTPSMAESVSTVTAECSTKRKINYFLKQISIFLNIFSKINLQMERIDAKRHI